MKTVYFVQANSIYGETEKSVYIPYAVGCIAAYCWQDEKIRNDYKLGRFIYIKENIDEVAGKIENPYIVAFSCYVWNTQYSKALAKKIKEKYPSCLIVFGGHNISMDAGTLDECWYVDILVHGGGEESFKNLLIALSKNNPLELMPNLSFRNSQNQAITTERKMPTETDYPSPYLNGYFEEILNDDICFSAIIETNRGCPEQCAFCDWGELKSKVRFFSLEKIQRELAWLAEHKIEYIYCADANFGLFDRDLEITDKIVELKNRTGYPKKLKANFTKNRFELVGKISKILNENNIGKSQTISFQSLSPQVLKNIGRRNPTMDYFSKLMVFYNSADIPTYSELILGLPGESYESFTDGICTLLELGQHKSIDVYICELLPNSQMSSKEYIERFGIESVDIPFDIFHCNPQNNPDKITEVTKAVISTNSMNTSDWVRTYLFATTILGFHNLGLTRYIAIFLRKEKQVAFKTFYANLIEYFNKRKSGLIYNTLSMLTRLFEGVTQCNNSLAVLDKRFGEITYEPGETLFLNCVYNCDLFYAEIEQYLKEYTIENDLMKEIIAFQKGMIKMPFRTKTSIRLSYDLYDYFLTSCLTTENVPLNKKHITYDIYDTCPVFSWEDYAKKIVWYGRRDEATLYLSKIYNVSSNHE